MVDEDGETHKTILIDNIVVKESGDNGECLVNCVEGKSCDVSKGDTCSNSPTTAMLPTEGTIGIRSSTLRTQP